MSGLSEYVSAKREAILAHRRSIDLATAQPRRVKAHVRAEGRAGVRRIAIRGHEILTDSGRETGGFDLGPSPVELLLGALGGCITHTFIVQAAVRGVPIDEIETEVTALSNPRAGHPAYPDVPVHPTDLRYEIRVASTASEPDLQTIFDATERICPITALLSGTQPITGSMIRTGEPAPLSPNGAANPIPAPETIDLPTSA